MEWRLLGLVRVRDETRQEVDQEVVGAAVACMLDLADVLELVVDALDDRAFAEEQLIGQGKETRAHVLARFSDEMDPLLNQEALRERLRDVAAVAEEFAKETADQPGDRTPFIHLARRQAEGQ